MPVGGIYNQAGAWRIEFKNLFFLPVMVGNRAASLNTNRCLNSFVMTMSATYGAVDTIDIKYPFDGKRNYPFDHSQIPSAVCECFKIDLIGHRRV